MKLIRIFIELINWLQIFILPAGIIGFAGFVCYKNIIGNLGLILFVLLLGIGIVLGVYFAEKVRRTIGCSTFMYRIFALQREERDEGDKLVL